LDFFGQLHVFPRYVQIVQVVQTVQSVYRRGISNQFRSDDLNDLNGWNVLNVF
jgi:hypothetical protein